MSDELIIPLQESPKEINYERFISSLLDKTSTIPPPSVIMQIKEYYGQQHYLRRLMTAGNLSVVQGKAKAGKTFFLSMMLPAIINATTSHNKFVGNADFIKDHPGVIMIDTEQAGHDGYQVMRRIVDNCGYSDGFGYSLLREYTPTERCDIIEATLEKFNGKLNTLIIDGIVDLTSGYNDEEKSSDLVTKLMRWSKIYNIHICNVIHENKDSTQASGWLGRLLYQKSETVISVSNTSERNIKKVKSELQRGTMSFSDFYFKIGEGNAEIVDGEGLTAKKF